MAPVSGVSNVTSSSNSNQNPSSPTAASAPTESMFLQLLVAQIKNQDPTKPVDSTQFMTQLAQFSNLEQLISLNTTVGKIGTVLGVPSDTSADAATGKSAS